MKRYYKPSMESIELEANDSILSGSQDEIYMFLCEDEEVDEFEG